MLRARTALIALIAALLAGCGQAASNPQPAPTGGSPDAASPTARIVVAIATPVPPTPRPVGSAAIATPAGTQGAPTPTVPLTPTFGTYRDPRGVFAVDVPSNWHTTPLREGVGLSSRAYNDAAIFSISFTWQADRLSQTLQAQLAEDVKSRTFASYLAKNVKLEGRADGADGYILAGTATLSGTPTTIEISLRQTAGGTVMLQSWLVPSELWAGFGTLFKEPMEASLTIDDAAAKSLTQQ